MEKTLKIWISLLVVTVLLSGCKNASFLKQRYTHLKRTDAGATFAHADKKKAGALPVFDMVSPAVQSVAPNNSPEPVTVPLYATAPAVKKPTTLPFLRIAKTQLASPKFTALKIKVAANTKRGPLGWLIDTVFGIIFSIVILVAIVLLIIFLLL